MRHFLFVLGFPLLLLEACPLSAEVLRGAVVGCSAMSDAQKIAQAQPGNGRDKTAALAISQPLVASRACLSFAKGLTIGIDERKPPFACIRLQGDLSCYWVMTAAIDDHPSEKGTAGGHHGGKRR